MERTGGEGQGRGGGGSSSTLPKYERVPRGRCEPPVTPSPNPRRGELMHSKKADAYSDSRVSRRPPSEIVVMSKGGRTDARKQMPKWKRGYVGFKRKVNSSALVPLLLIVTVCGAGVHVVGLMGVSLGFFTWSIGCEGVVTVTGDSERASGIQTYKLGWVRYKGAGPSKGSDSPTLTGDDDNSSANNGTTGAMLGKGGVAGSSIPQVGWLASIDALSPAFGALAAAGHLAGLAFYVIALFVAQRLFRRQFRSDRRLFRPAMRGATLLLAWMVGTGAVGFYLSTRESFAGSVLDILHSEGFLCQNNKNVGGNFSYIATVFSCVASFIMVLLTWWFGEAADLALFDGFNRKASLAGIAGP